MSNAIKIGVIGAGSAEFSAGLVNDLCRTESLTGSHVTFMDVKPERMEMILRLAVRFADELGMDLTFDTTTDREVALQDADFGSGELTLRYGDEVYEIWFNQ